jgi:hypothetical protein
VQHPLPYWRGVIGVQPVQRELSGFFQGLDTNGIVSPGQGMSGAEDQCGGLVLNGPPVPEGLREQGKRSGQDVTRRSEDMNGVMKW